MNARMVKGFAYVVYLGVMGSYFLMGCSSAMGQISKGKVSLETVIKSVALKKPSAGVSDDSANRLVVKVQIIITNGSAKKLIFLDDLSKWPEAEIFSVDPSTKQELTVLRTIKDSESTELSSKVINARLADRNYRSDHMRIINQGDSLALDSEFVFLLNEDHLANAFSVPENNISVAELLRMNGLEFRVMHAFVATNPSEYSRTKEFSRKLSKTIPGEFLLIPDRLWSSATPFKL